MHPSACTRSPSPVRLDLAPWTLAPIPSPSAKRTEIGSSSILFYASNGSIDRHVVVLAESQGKARQPDSGEQPGFGCRVGSKKPPVRVYGPERPTQKLPFSLSTPHLLYPNPNKLMASPRPKSKCVFYASRFTLT